MSLMGSDELSLEDFLFFEAGRAEDEGDPDPGTAVVGAGVVEEGLASFSGSYLLLRKMLGPGRTVEMEAASFFILMIGPVLGGYLTIVRENIRICCRR